MEPKNQSKEESMAPKNSNLPTVPSNPERYDPPEAPPDMQAPPSSHKKELPELRSEEIQDILSMPPHWMLRWTSGIILVMVIGIVVWSSYISYPDKLTTEAQITLTDPIEYLKAPINGRLKQIHYESGDLVRANEIIAEIANPISLEEIRSLLQWMDERNRHNFEKDDLDKYQSIVRKLLSISNRSEISMSEDTLLPNTGEVLSSEDQRKLFDLLKQQIKKWEHLFLIRPKTEGTLAYVAITSDHNLIEKEDNLFAVIPKDQEFIIKMAIPIENYHQIKLGQEIILKLANYPFQRFGTLKGTITSIADLPYQGNYLVTGDLDDGYVSSLGYELELTTEMSASADVIINDQSLFDRMFGTLINMIHQ